MFQIEHKLLTDPYKKAGEQLANSKLGERSKTRNSRVLQFHLLLRVAGLLVHESVDLLNVPS